MSEYKDNENEFERDFSEETNDETVSNDTDSGSVEEKIVEANDDLLEDVTEVTDQEIDPIAEANESLITMNSAPFEQTLEIMTQTLASIDAKMDVESPQLKKLDQLSEIKDQLNRLENTSLATAAAGVDPGTEVTAETEEDVPQNNIGHNQQEISELLEKIQILENKIQTIENQSNSSNERFEKIESVVERFEDLESEIHVEYEEVNEKKSFFKKNPPTMPYKELKKENKESEEISREDENLNNEITIDTDPSIEGITDSEMHDNETYKKSKKISYGMLLLLIMTITILFFFNKFQIIYLNSVIKNISSLF